MRIWLLGLGLGFCSTALPVLTPGTVMACIIALVVATRALRVGSGVRCVLTLVTAVLIGHGWGAWQIGRLLDARPPGCVEQGDQRLLIEVTDQPGPVAGSRAPGRRFAARVLDQSEATCASLQGATLRLSWFEAPQLGQGQRWWVDVRLRLPWGYRNPGGFDHARWMLGRGIQASGYVLQGTLIDAPAARRAAPIRQRLNERLASPHLPRGGIIYALVSGDGSLIPPATWDALRATGTIHLMVVSGLHVGLVGALGYWIGALALRAWPTALLWISASRAGALVALFTAGAYVLATGAGLPSQRAWLMFAIAVVYRLSGRKARRLRLLLLVFVVLLALTPEAVHRQGFWLSFAAVTSLLLVFDGRLQRARRLGGFLRAQVTLAVGMAPWLTLLVGQVPVVGPLANLLTVGIMAFLVLPASLASAATFVVVEEWGERGFVALDRLLGWVVELLLQLSRQLPVLVDPGVWLAGAAALGAAGLLAGTAGRPLLVLVLLWAGWARTPSLGVNPGEFRVTALDVGQGSAINVDTHGHRLLFDAGPRFPSGFDLGAAAVVPSLVATGPARLDVLVISHADVDHAGGAGAVRRALPVARVIGPVGTESAELCVEGLSWQWDGVRFTFLNDGSVDASASDNDRSCVLHVGSARRSVLLPGDITRKVEARIGRRVAPVDLTFAPHHGSASSSSKAFVRLLRPRLVFVSAGKLNRFGHPHPNVVARYADEGARVFVTGLHGALTWRSDRPDEVRALRRVRQTPYWVPR